eukprot:5596122-Prymnesium_polylepis.1
MPHISFVRTACEGSPTTSDNRGRGARYIYLRNGPRPGACARVEPVCRRTGPNSAISALCPRPLPVVCTSLRRASYRYM